jgi:hypothetical protein
VSYCLLGSSTIAYAVEGLRGLTYCFVMKFSELANVS